MEIELGNMYDIDNWMNLVDRVKGNFPGLETKEALEEHRKTVLSFMGKNSAICAKIDDKIVGTLLFSKDNNELCFLAVDTEYRRQHIAEKMVSYMLTFMDPESDIVVTTYREGVPEGIAARAFYKRLGFVEGKLTEEFGSPVQEFILKR
ncbi:GNAT family N-acetyltransferase [Intestinibacter sp.]|uniref:GNAT family N-acetyltransferase n=1 Tax=Intestinibacter sp. TaxID=1965304 RepID=UPI003F14D25B